MPVAMIKRGAVDFFMFFVIFGLERLVNGRIFKGLAPLFNPKIPCQGGWGLFSL
jgi:TM2 domain-containing membrane protein YozV